jgi:hypothetical protein
MKMQRAIGIGVILFLFLFPAVLFGGKKSGENQVNFFIVEEGANIAADNRNPNIEIFRDETRFRDWHSRVHRNTIPRPATPTVDFGTHFVVFLTYGEQPSAGYFIKVRTVLERGDIVAIRTLLTEPSQDSFQAQAVTFPYVFVAIPRNGFNRVEWANVTGEVFYSRPI